MNETPKAVGPDFSRTHGIVGWFRRWIPVYLHFSLTGWYYWFTRLIYTFGFLLPTRGFSYREPFRMPSPDRKSVV